MEFIKSVLKCFCFEVEDDQHRPSEEALPQLFLTTNETHELIHLTILNLLKDAISTAALNHQNDLEFQQSQDYRSESSDSDSREQEVLDFEESNENVVVIDFGEERWINDYSSSQKILLVGEGDFSFSAALAKAFGSASNITATSLDSIGFLKKNYGRAISNIRDLKRRGCKVIHGVDATKMVNNPLFKDMKFDRVIFNFPQGAGFSKKESRETPRKNQETISLWSRHQSFLSEIMEDIMKLIDEYQTRVSEFLENAKAMINEDGEIHVTHLTDYGYNSQWNIEYLGTSQGLKFKQAAEFNWEEYPDYRTKTGFEDDDLDCNPSVTYKFGL